MKHTRACLRWNLHPAGRGAAKREVYFVRMARAEQSRKAVEYWVAYACLHGRVLRVSHLVDSTTKGEEKEPENHEGTKGIRRAKEEGSGLAAKKEMARE